MLFLVLGFSRKFSTSLPSCLSFVTPLPSYLASGPRSVGFETTEPAAAKGCQPLLYMITQGVYPISTGFLQFRRKHTDLNFLFYQIYNQSSLSLSQIKLFISLYLERGVGEKIDSIVV